MPRMVENPRYHVFTFRADDETAERIRDVVGGGTRQDFLLAAVQEKLDREKAGAAER